MRTSRTAVAVAAALLLTACDAAAERIAEEAAEAAAGGDAEIDVDDEGNLSVDSSEGSFEIDAGGDGELPDGFPDGVPLPDGDVAASTSFSDDSGQTFSVTFVAPGIDGAAFLDDAGSQLEADGYTVANETNSSDGSGGGFSSLSVSNDERSVNYTVITEGEGGETTVQVGVGPAPPS